eukprot:gene20010-biopygen22079
MSGVGAPATRPRLKRDPGHDHMSGVGAPSCSAG